MAYYTLPTVTWQTQLVASLFNPYRWVVRGVEGEDWWRVTLWATV